MPYCPKCDMEFVDGITTCSDCGGPLVASKEEADRLKREEQLKRQKEQQNLTQEMLSMEMNGANADSFSGHASEDFHNLANSDDPDVSTKGSRSTDPASAISFKQQSTAYVDKGQKYEDLRSSASAFLIVGGAVLIFSALCWLQIVRLPMAGFSRYLIQTALTAMGIFSMVVYIKSNRSARDLLPQIEEEKQKTNDLIQWFLSEQSAQDIDREILDLDQLNDEEISLKRFQIIQDYLITHKDLPDPAYVDALCEEIYTKLYEEN